MSGRWSVTDSTHHVPVAERLGADVRAGLTLDPPWLPPKWFYDEKGSLLFEEITRLPEYYPTRAEESILAERSAEIAARTGAGALVEIGAGASRKTRLLLDALTAGDRPVLFVPLDVSAEMLRTAAARIAEDYPTVEVAGIVADFDDPLPPLPGEPGKRLVAFLGSTIGNLTTELRRDFLRRIRDAMQPGDGFLLGADLVKDPARLVAAYDDAQGVTAAFNRNLIEVLGRLLDAGLDPADFEHVARWNADEERIEMWLRARRPVHARFPSIDLDWSLPEGGELLTETSQKFRLPALREELAAAGLAPARSWTDAAGDFSLTLALAG